MRRHASLMAEPEAQMDMYLTIAVRTHRAMHAIGPPQLRYVPATGSGSRMSMSMPTGRHVRHEVGGQPGLDCFSDDCLRNHSILSGSQASQRALKILVAVPTYIGADGAAASLST